MTKGILVAVGAALALVVGYVAATAWPLDDDTANPTPTALAERATAVTGASNKAELDDVEFSVREKVLLEGQQLVSALMISDDGALEDMRRISPVEVSAQVEVGDFYLIFTDTQVLYRPSNDRVVETVAVVDLELPAPVSDEQQTPTEPSPTTVSE